ncbi:uncharacterized protein BKCO1_1400095 [Diplodia corticola]|uniref:Uncharacterized protein n=1 Tax=Diplodia corticola TaxID=236234 RepID=A0A1J9R721_9PEZI|nr:uncharacterized protein BKCO1_1400095 [Diplodia corticola]OJD36010.1 hypothetical protein BKCO1_1400095 [Diplodia corticola]
MEDFQDQLHAVTLSTPDTDPAMPTWNSVPTQPPVINRGSPAHYETQLWSDQQTQSEPNPLSPFSSSLHEALERQLVELNKPDQRVQPAAARPTDPPTPPPDSPQESRKRGGVVVTTTTTQPHHVHHHPRIAAANHLTIGGTSPPSPPHEPPLQPQQHTPPLHHPKPISSARAHFLFLISPSPSPSPPFLSPTSSSSAPCSPSYPPWQDGGGVGGKKRARDEGEEGMEREYEGKGGRGEEWSGGGAGAGRRWWGEGGRGNVGETTMTKRRRREASVRRTEKKRVKRVEDPLGQIPGLMPTDNLVVLGAGPRRAYGTFVSPFDPAYRSPYYSVPLPHAHNWGVPLYLEGERAQVKEAETTGLERVTMRG